MSLEGFSEAQDRIKTAKKLGQDTVDRPKNAFFERRFVKESNLADNLSAMVGRGMAEASAERAAAIAAQKEAKLHGKRGNSDQVAPAHHLNASRPAGKANDQAERAKRNKLKKKLRLN